ncbi:MAG: hypothetical protein ABS951_16785 [Solibacillus sp.]
MLTNIIILICVLNALRVLYNNRDRLKKLSLRQWVNVIALYAGVIGVLFVAVYYGANWISDYFENYYVKLGVFLVVFLGVGSVLVRPFERLRDKATGGILK